MTEHTTKIFQGSNKALMPQQQSEIFEQSEGINIKFDFNKTICLNMSTTAQTKSAGFTHVTKRRFLSVIENMSVL